MDYSNTLLGLLDNYTKDSIFRLLYKHNFNACIREIKRLSGNNKRTTLAWRIFHNYVNYHHMLYEYRDFPRYYHIRIYNSDGIRESFDHTLDPIYHNNPYLKWYSETRHLLSFFI